MKNLLSYLDKKGIKYKSISEYVIEIDGKTYDLIKPIDGKIFDSSFEMVCDDTEEDNYVFKFGGRYYWTPQGTEQDCELNPLINLGKVNAEPPYISNLAIHGKYEVLNGGGTYEKWCKKANFLKCESLGITELNSLAGCMQFQNECEKYKIKSIQGISLVLADLKKDYRFLIKIYAKNNKGWQTLLKCSYIANVVNNGYITLEDLKEIDRNHIYLIVDPKESKFEEISFDYDFYQFDTVKFEINETDKSYLKNFKKFVDSKKEPILIQDSYYLEPEDWELKECINKVGDKGGKLSKNQYFKRFDDVLEELDEICKDENKFDNLLEVALSNLQKVTKECNFKIETGNRHLPKYPMTEDEIEKYGTVENMFYTLLEEGIKAKAPKGEEDKYIDRISKEVEVIEFGNVIDYFLETRDYVNWAKENDILVGTGRGCFTEDSLIKMTDGSYKIIREIEEGDLIYNYFNNEAKVENLFQYEVNEEMVEITLSNSISFKCTKDHEIHTKNRGWVNADDLTEKDDINFVKR